MMEISRRLHFAPPWIILYWCLIGDREIPPIVPPSLYRLAADENPEHETPKHECFWKSIMRVLKIILNPI